MSLTQTVMLVCVGTPGRLWWLELCIGWVVHGLLVHGSLAHSYIPVCSAAAATRASGVCQIGTLAAHERWVCVNCVRRKMAAPTQDMCVCVSWGVRLSTPPWCFNFKNIAHPRCTYPKSDAYIAPRGAHTESFMLKRKEALLHTAQWRPQAVCVCTDLKIGWVVGCLCVCVSHAHVGTWEWVAFCRAICTRMHRAIS